MRKILFNTECYDKLQQNNNSYKVQSLLKLKTYFIYRSTFDRILFAVGNILYMFYAQNPIYGKLLRSADIFKMKHT